MSQQLEEATARLRGDLLDGAFAPGEKLKEIEIAQRLGCSRTLARLAMSALEGEGLLVREANRGTRARAFSIDEVTAAIEVRGELEGMAARLAAERGIDSLVRGRLEARLSEADVLLAKGVVDDPQRRAWIQMNTGFHDTLLAASGNWAIGVAVAHISVLPIASAASIIFDRTDPQRGLMQLRLSHYDHLALFEAVLNRQGGRAEALMREHAFKSAQNKRRNLRDPATMAHTRSLPGASLIAIDTPEPGGEPGGAGEIARPLPRRPW